MNPAVCLALLLLVVHGFPQRGRRAYIPLSAEGNYEPASLEAPPVSMPKRRAARAAEYVFEPSSFSSEAFLQCCKKQGFDDACANFMCQWQNVWRVEPGQVYTEGHTPKTCIETVPQFNAYKNCLTNFKAAMPDTMKRTKGQCAEICDGTSDFTAGVSLNLFDECGNFKNDTVTEENRPNAEFFRLLWCNAGAYLSPMSTTHNPLNVTIDCGATKTVDINGFKVVGCVRSK